MLFPELGLDLVEAEGEGEEEEHSLALSLASWQVWFFQKIFKEYVHFHSAALLYFIGTRFE